MRKAAHKILEGLKEALAFARGEPEGARVTVYEYCYGCGNATKTVNGKCELCHHERKI